MWGSWTLAITAILVAGAILIGTAFAWVTPIFAIPILLLAIVFAVAAVLATRAGEAREVAPREWRDWPPGRAADVRSRGGMISSRDRAAPPPGRRGGQRRRLMSGAPRSGGNPRGERSDSRRNLVRHPQVGRADLRRVVAPGGHQLVPGDSGDPGDDGVFVLRTLEQSALMIPAGDSQL